MNEQQNTNINPETEDVEGHLARFKAAPPGEKNEDDVEGHANRFGTLPEMPEDETEGHVLKARVSRGEDDTEGHAFKIKLAPDEGDDAGDHGANSNR